MAKITKKQIERLDSLAAQGFDNSEFTHEWGFRVACTQCAARVINGTPCHERGCPNEKHECKGCNAMLPPGVVLCADCLGLNDWEDDLAGDFDDDCTDCLGVDDDDDDDDGPTPEWDADYREFVKRDDFTATPGNPNEFMGYGEF